ncbi:TPA: L-histidine N(alpha)-methyltransferase [Candidatus Poribacteria bacterium]|nr:L-histidine N(alpha)-methyltransferase [Candidatus Poribacteria bacterium]
MDLQNKRRVVSGVNLVEVETTKPLESIISAVSRGLLQTPKSLPCWLFYDSVGSKLFEKICQLPEYHITRTEEQILRTKAAEIIQGVSQGLSLVELGSGNSGKTRLLIDAILERQATLHYIPIDISSEFLLQSSIQLLTEYNRLSVTAMAAEYQAAMPILAQQSISPALILFLGSNISNFDSGEASVFLQQVREHMSPSDRLLIGVDLVKETSIIEAAYNDSSGVTEAFNKNLLIRLNREIGANFVINQFDHWAPFIESESRIEMRLISRVDQSVSIRDTGESYDLSEGEYIHTENSYKYTITHFNEISQAAGFEIEQQWQDERGWFSVVMLCPRSSKET